MLRRRRRISLSCIFAATATVACADETVTATDVGNDALGTGSSMGDSSDTGYDDTGGETDTGEPEPEPECGNGVVEAGEECDDGNDIHNDACTNDCTAAACGDGLIQPGEECDSGADNGANSACLDSCEENVCGDGFVGPGEACDDGNDIDDDGCSNDCSPVTCGDGGVDTEAGEQCDDGNDDNSDGCLGTCVFASCGDGFVQLADQEGIPLPVDQQEECDDGPQNSDSAGCTSVCKLAVCGDSLVYGDVEECDNGPDNGADGSCLEGCVDNVCGDGFLGPTEGCDDGNEENNDGCSSSCAPESCGDGLVQEGEECDDGQNGDNADGCTDACKFEVCGDGFVQDGEGCDEGNDNADSGDCTSSCTVAVCGDGFVWGNNEECDNGPANADDAECTSACADAVCGDGLVGPNEGCDDGNNLGGDGCGATCISEECGNGIVDPAEECDDGNDVDDDECTNACTIPIPCDGPYVSKDTCVPNDQCGTIARPWCTINAGINNTISSPVRVAATGTQYYEQVHMRDGVDVLGGYEPSFQQPRDPATNETTILAHFLAVVWLGAIDATLDGFTVRTEGPWDDNPIPPEHEIIGVSSTANATLTDVIVEPHNADVYADEAFALRVRGGVGGGSVIISGQSSLTAPRAWDRSVGVLVDDGLTLTALTVNDAHIEGGQATSSYGVQDLGFAPGSFINAELRGGTGLASAGLVAGRVGHPGVELDASTVHGGLSRAATGVDYRNGAHLWITGGTLTGGGVAHANTVSTGVLIDEVEEVIIDGATVVGSDVLGVEPTTSAAAIDLRNTGLQPMTGATLTNVNLDGGSSTTSARGLRVQGVPATLSASVVRGSNSHNGTGVNVHGAVLPGASVTISNNPEITGTSLAGADGVAIHVEADQAVDIDSNTLVTGCSSPSGCNSGYGLYAQGQAPVTVTNNTRFAGCEGPSRVCAAALFVDAGPGHVLSNNVEVVGGPGNDELGVHHAISIARASVTVSDNQLISAAPDTVDLARRTRGIELRNGTLVAERNGLITGGHAYHDMGTSAEARAIWAHAVNGELNTVILRDNYIIGGSSTAGASGVMFETQIMATVERNVVRVCPFDTGDPRCGSGTAFATVGDLGSVYVNNFFFGGHDGNSAGCSIGCRSGMACTGNQPLLLSFEHNLCTVEQGNAAMIVEDFWNVGGERPWIANNIFHAYHWSDVGVRYVTGGGAQRSFDFHHNDVLTSWDCLVQHDQTIVCASTAAEINALDGNGHVFASNNVNIDPSHVNEDPAWPTAAGYHLDGTCALEDLGEVTASTSTDFDGDPRGEGNPDLPEIGPDECEP